jgi:outer membrane translocation and assembly module TamA
VIKGDVPPTERYYAGGVSSQRGFAERRLSPLARSVDADGDEHSVVIGGVTSFQTGVEARTSFMPYGAWKVGVVGFLDGGDVTETADELDLGHLHWAVGLGVRPYYLPIGPLGLDVAYRLNRTGPGEPSAGHHWNWHISIGETF